MRIRILWPVLAAFALALAIFAPPAGATTDQMIPHNDLCGVLFEPCALSFNGVSGDRVLVKTQDVMATNQQVNTAYIAAPNCNSGTSLVQDGQDGDDNCPNQSNYWWPATVHSLDTKWGDVQGSIQSHVVEIYAEQHTTIAYGATDKQVYQTGGAHSGWLWVRHLAPDTISGGYFYYSNVLVSDANSTQGNNHDFLLREQPMSDNAVVCQSCSTGETEWEVT